MQLMCLKEVLKRVVIFGVLFAAVSVAFSRLEFSILWYFCLQVALYTVLLGSSKREADSEAAALILAMLNTFGFLFLRGLEKGVTGVNGTFTLFLIAIVFSGLTVAMAAISAFLLSRRFGAGWLKRPWRNIVRLRGWPRYRWGTRRSA